MGNPLKKTALTFPQARKVLEVNWSACTMRCVADSRVRLEGVWRLLLQVRGHGIFTNHTGNLYREPGFYLYLPVSFASPDIFHTITEIPIYSRVLCVFPPRY
jgi:hypothetical protein